MIIYGYFVFNKLKVYGNAVLSKSLGAIFFQHLFTSCLFHILIILTVFCSFYGDLWSAILDVTIVVVSLLLSFSH